MSVDGLNACLEKMRAEGLPEAAIANFEHYYRKLESGQTGLLAESDLEPVTSLIDAEDLPREADAPLDRAVMVKLNGGLGTSMGLRGPKSLLEVKDGMSFLDVIARQVASTRERSCVDLPLVLMNSFSTQEPSMAALARRRVTARDFLQHKEPKLRADDLMPISWPADPSLEWCPPGHGDLYTALETSGMLAELLGAGHRYAFVSNVDNLGATLDPAILAWFAGSGAPFAMEVADRTEADRKGGHLASSGGRLVLREIAQTPEEDLDSFQDVTRHQYFNTNNLWLDLEAVSTALRDRGQVLGLPMIVNRKTVDPTDKESPAVFQLETAMGSAIGVFEGALALRVPRTRFGPVKTTSDLLVLRSDAYLVTDDGRLELAPERDGRAPVVSLDDSFKLVGDLEARFEGVPSLVGCERLVVRGDVTFEPGVVVRGAVEVEGPRRVRAGEQLTG